MASQEITVPGKAARVRGATWTHDQVLKLFEVWMEPEIYNGLLMEKKKVDIFKKMASILSSQGVNRKWSEVRAKIKNLKADFRKAIEKKSAFRYYAQMREIMNLDGSSGTNTRGRTPSSNEESQDRSYLSHSRSEAGSEEEEVGESDQEEQRERCRSRSTETVRTEVVYQESTDSPRGDIHSRSSDEGEIISNVRTVVRTLPYQQPQSPVTTPEKLYYQASDQSGQVPYASSSWSQQQQYGTAPSPRVPTIIPEYHRQSYYDDLPHTSTSIPQFQRQRHDLSEHDYNSSRPSMSTSHVVSKVIEPVTSIVVPSRSQSEKGDSESFEFKKSPAPIPSVHSEPGPEQDPFTGLEASTPSQMPIRLEFVVENENVVLKSSSAEVPGGIPYHDQDRHHHGTSTVYEDSSCALRAQVPDSTPPSQSPPLPTIISVTSRPITPSPVLPAFPDPPQSFDDSDDLSLGSIHPSTPERIRRPGRYIPTPTHRPGMSTLPRKTVRVLKPQTHPRRKLFPGRRPPPSSPKPRQASTSTPTTTTTAVRKRKLLESLNKKTLDTISSLLTETSQSLLKELQESEHRFLMWEEEKRKEERVREEQMFAKLITALASSPTSSGDLQAESSLRGPDQESHQDYVTSLKDVSKRLNDLVSDEVKATEETIKQWEVKMQRQESRHTEKIFAMLVNAMKRPELD